jgi:hypothetical protein
VDRASHKQKCLCYWIEKQRRLEPTSNGLRSSGCCGKDLSYIYGGGTARGKGEKSRQRRRRYGEKAKAKSKTPRANTAHGAPGDEEMRRQGRRRYADP